MNSAALRDGVRCLFELYEREPEHPLHVARLAGQILSGLLPMGMEHPGSADLLEAAALLHDIGWTVSGPDGSGHHKATARLIRDYAWPGVSQPDIERIALIARYHRKALPAPHHLDFALLPPPDQQTVRYLGGILRVADALDRRHIQRVEHVVIRSEPSGLHFLLQGTDELAPEIEAVQRKGDLLRQELGVPLVYLKQ